MAESKDGINTSRDADIGEAGNCPREDSHRHGAQDEPVTTACRSIGGQQSWVAVILTIVVVSLFSSATSVFVYDRFFAQKVVTANISKFLLDQRDLYFQGKIDKQQYVNSLNSFIILLKSQPKNRIVILEDVVAANAERLEPR